MIEQLFLNGIITGVIYSLVAISFTLIYQTTRFFPAFYAYGGFGGAGISLTVLSILLVLMLRLRSAQVLRRSLPRQKPGLSAYFFYIQLGFERLVASPRACLTTMKLVVGLENQSLHREIPDLPLLFRCECHRFFHEV